MELLFIHKVFYERAEWISQGRTALRQLLHLEALIAAHILYDSQMQAGPVTDMLLLQTVTITCMISKVRTHQRLCLRQPTSEGCDAAWWWCTHNHMKRHEMKMPQGMCRKTEKGKLYAFWHELSESMLVSVGLPLGCAVMQHEALRGVC